MTLLTVSSEYLLSCFSAELAQLLVWLVFLNLGHGSYSNNPPHQIISHIWLFAWRGYSWVMRCLPSACPGSAPRPSSLFLTSWGIPAAHPMCPPHSAELWTTISYFLLQKAQLHLLRFKILNFMNRTINFSDFRNQVVGQKEASLLSTPLFSKCQQNQSLAQRL